MAYQKHILLGRISKIHGFEGAVTVRVEKSFSNKMPGMESVFLEIEGKMVPFFLSSSEQTGPGLLRLRFEGYESAAKVNEFRGLLVYLTTGRHHANIPDDFPDLKDFIVFSHDNELIGVIKEVIHNPGQLLLKVIADSGKQILLPLHEDLVKEVKVNRKIIIMDIPEGVSDIN